MDLIDLKNKKVKEDLDKVEKILQSCILSVQQSCGHQKITYLKRFVSEGWVGFRKSIEQGLE